MQPKPLAKDVACLQTLAGHMDAASETGSARLVLQRKPDCTPHSLAPIPYPNCNCHSSFRDVLRVGSRPIHLQVASKSSEMGNVGTVACPYYLMQQMLGRERKAEKDKISNPVMPAPKDPAAQ